MKNIYCKLFYESLTFQFFMRNYCCTSVKCWYFFLCRERRRSEEGGGRGEREGFWYFSFKKRSWVAWPEERFTMGKKRQRGKKKERDKKDLGPYSVYTSFTCFFFLFSFSHQGPGDRGSLGINEGQEFW